MSSLLIGSSFHFFLCLRAPAPPAALAAPQNRVRAIIRWSAWGFPPPGFLGPFTSGFAIDSPGASQNAFMVLVGVHRDAVFVDVAACPGFLPKRGQGFRARRRQQPRAIDLWKMRQRLRGAFIASGILSAGVGFVPVLFSDLRSRRSVCRRPSSAPCSPVFALATFIDPRVFLPWRGPGALSEAQHTGLRASSSPPSRSCCFRFSPTRWLLCAGGLHPWTWRGLPASRCRCR